MEESEKNLLENLKNFDITKLFTRNSYVEVITNDNRFFQVYILREKPNQKYDILIESSNKPFDVEINLIHFYGENNYQDETKIRRGLLNQNLLNLEISKMIRDINNFLLKYNINLNSKNSINNNSTEKDNNSISTSSISSNNIQNNNVNKIPDKTGKLIDITGYIIYQFLGGSLLDYLIILINRIDNNRNENSDIDLLVLILDIIIYVADIVKLNLNKYKIAYYNRKLLIVSQLHAILICFDSLINNLTPFFRYNFSKVENLNKKLLEIGNLVYEIILASKYKNAIPFHSLIIFIKILRFYDGQVIENYNKKEIYEILNEHMRNLDKNELIFYKKDSSMREICNNLVCNLFNNKMEDYIDETYYSYLLSCLKCNNLEKKINALNDLNNIINESYGKPKINNSFKNFIQKNNILDIFFEDSIHDEIIKRSLHIFGYLAKYDCLNDDIIEKIIQRQKTNELMKKIVIEILSQLSKDKKSLLFNRLTSGLKFDTENTNNIDYILKLTESALCYSDLDMKEESNETAKDNENTENEIEIEENGDKKDNNYYGLNIILDYIIKDFDDKIKFGENNIDKAVNYFVESIQNILKESNDFKVEDIFFFIERLFENIKTNKAHNSIIQSIKIIYKLFIFMGKKKQRSNFIKNLQKLDEKYDIINLIINDLTRYIKLLPDDYSNEIGKNNIYEGIYPHFINIEQRLNLIFYFFKKNFNNYEINIEGKKHIEKIYEVLKPEKFVEERKLFYKKINQNISQFEDSILNEFYHDILTNKKEFNFKEINDNESTDLIIKIFKQINENNEDIIYDGRNIRVGEKGTIEGTDMLFDILTQNSNQIVQEKISELLCDICLKHKNYNNEKLSEYWKTYFNKINSYLDNIINTNDKIALNGIIKLINKIYTNSINCCGKIPKKSDYQTPKEMYKYYNFININTKETRKLKVGKRDRIIDLRYKIGCLYNINVNNVTFIDIDGNIYTLNDDFEFFQEIFINDKYLNNKDFEYVKIKETPFGLLEMDNNPKLLIDTNDKLFNILVNNLKININNQYNNEMADKQKIFDFISKLPNKYYFENKIKKYGNKEKINDDELVNIFNSKEIYLMTYSLHCFHFAFFEENNEINEGINKQEYLNNFLEIYRFDKILINILLDFQLDPDNCYSIHLEGLNSIIKVLIRLQNYKETKNNLCSENFVNDEKIFNNLLKRLAEIISELLFFDYNKCKTYMTNDNDELSIDRSYDISEELNDIIKELGNNIFYFLDEITKNKISFMNFLFNDKDLFIKIFINDFIKSRNKEMKEIVENYLYKNCGLNNENINNYLEIVLSVEIFNYLIQNDKNGKYFQVISLVLKQNFSENKEKEILIEASIIDKSKAIIDLILNYIQKEFDNNEENDSKMIFFSKEYFKEGIILILSNILNINQKELISYMINKIDICDFFINKCIFRKCIKKPLEINKPFCLNENSKTEIYNLLINILIYLDNENEKYIFNKTIDLLDNFNKLGFWKKNNVRNWNFETKDNQKGKYIGLKNMNSTCYLNSIIQQLFMIPIFRETIIKIENPYNDNVLFELQLLFSALKVYEFSFYNAKSFVLANKLNFYEQMDAYEFYCTLIDKIENDIKNIYSKNNNKYSQKTYKYKNLFNHFFEIKVLDELEFVGCGHKRFNEFCYNNIQLEIKDYSNLNESLKNYFKTEIMDGDNKINCEDCKTKRTCHKHLILKTLPNILVISLKRFEFDYAEMVKYKLNKYFEFPYKLDMKDYLIENHEEKNTEYELTGITIHWGVSDFGHYFDLIKDQDNKWYKFNDTNVTEFKEEDIPKESFGEAGNSDDDSYKEKENRNTAYILFYTKKGNNMLENSDKTDLALPPYDKYSNIKNEIIEIINTKLYKSWAIINLFSISYHNFVMELLKMDLAKIVDNNIEKNHYQIYLMLKNEGYYKNIEEKEKEENDIGLTINNDQIFKFGLRYYFNVLLRIARKSQDHLSEYEFEKFKEMIIIYIEKDINKGIYILEEFSNEEALREYLVYCPNKSSVDDCINIIIKIIELLSRDINNIINENSIIYLFFNRLNKFIAYYLKKVNLENVNNLFCKIINMNNSQFLTHLKKKKMNNWTNLLIRRVNDQEIFKNIFNEENLPVLKSNHSILVEKSFVDEDKRKKTQNDDNDFHDHNFFIKLENLKNNQALINELIEYLNKE